MGAKTHNLLELHVHIMYFFINFFTFYFIVTIFTNFKINNIIKSIDFNLIC